MIVDKDSANFVIAVDSFKGSLSSLEAGCAVKEAVISLYPKAIISVFPLADGGEGTVKALCSGLGGTMKKLTVHGPLNMPVEAEYCILNDKITAVIEMASAAGISLIDKEQLNPLKTTTFGVGELIKDALHNGCRKFIIGIGGSATNDGGAGMLQALGFRLLDSNGTDISFGAEGLKDLCRITTDCVLKELNDAVFQIACDVGNPLCGENGCSTVFAPQKGANLGDIAKMDKWLAHYADVAKTVCPAADKITPGAGAAGGLGFAFLCFTNSKLESGIKIVMDETGIEEHIKKADFVITGEGKLDSQTVMGKAPVGIAKLAKKYNKKVIAFSGCVSDDASICNEYGIDAFFSIMHSPSTLEDALKKENAYRNLKSTAYQVFRLMKCLQQ